MHAHGFILYTPPTPFLARFIMIEETSKTLYDVDLETPEDNPASWKEGRIPTDTGRNLAIVIPVRLDDFSKEIITEQGLDPTVEVGKLVSITRQDTGVVHGNILGRVIVRPADDRYMTWDKIREYKGEIIRDEMKNGLLAKVYGGAHTDQAFVHPERLAIMPRQWHQNAELLNVELDGLFVSADAVEREWILSEDGTRPEDQPSE